MTDEWQSDPEIQAAALEGFLSNPVAVAYAQASQEPSVSDDLVTVRVDTETEAYPVLSIGECGGSDPPSGLRIPRRLLGELRAAYSAVDAAEYAIMRRIGDIYGTPSVLEWLADHEEGER
jgi:hypothetical protein